MIQKIRSRVSEKIMLVLLILLTILELLVENNQNANDEYINDNIILET